MPQPPSPTWKLPSQPFHINEGGKIWDKNGTGDKEHRKHHQHAVLIQDTPEAE